MRIELESDIVEVNSYVKGSVFLTIRKEVVPTNLNLKFKVKEETAWNSKQEVDGRIYYNSY